MCHRESLRNKQHKGFLVCYVNLFPDDANFTLGTRLVLIFVILVVDIHDLAFVTGVFKGFCKAFPGCRIDFTAGNNGDAVGAA